MGAAAVTLQAAVRAGATVPVVATARVVATVRVGATLEDRPGAGMLGHFDDSGLGFTSITKQKLRIVPPADLTVVRPAATLRRMVVLAPTDRPVVDRQVVDRQVAAIQEADRLAGAILAADRLVAAILSAERPVSAIPGAILSAKLPATEVTLAAVILAFRPATTRNR